MQKNTLSIPLRHIFVTQPFGANYVDFYSKLGLKGHNGIDFMVNPGVPCYASHDGMVTWAGIDGDGGISVTLWNRNGKFKTIYYHLKDVVVNEGEHVTAGTIIGHCDNTGKYTTGDHLHFGLKETDELGNTINYQNGYQGAIDPAPYMVQNWDKPPVWFGYGAIQSGWGGRSWDKELKAKAYLWLKLKRQPKYLEVMARAYGEWEYDEITNPNMYYIWMYVRKPDYLKGTDKPDLKPIYKITI